MINWLPIDDTKQVGKLDLKFANWGLKLPFAILEIKGEICLIHFPCSPELEIPLESGDEGIFDISDLAIEQINFTGRVQGVWVESFFLDTVNKVIAIKILHNNTFTLEEK